MKTIAIIGAGYSGVSVAINLAHYASEKIQVLLFEKNNFAEGIAYSTRDPHHLLNIHAGAMSAFDDKPDDFVEWLKESPIASQYLDSNIEATKQYLPRYVYGIYLCALLEAAQHDDNKLVHIECIHAEVVDIVKQSEIILANGDKYHADKIVLALGNQLPKALPVAIPDRFCINNPWDITALKSIPADKDVLLVGSGLTMVDVAVTLHHQAHQGKMFTLSRRGLYPQAHQPVERRFTFSQALDFKNLAELIRCVRKEIDDFSALGDWRAVVNALRPSTQAIWQDLSEHEKQRFLRHLMPYWEIHRHRIAPKVAKTIAHLQEVGQLSIMAGRLINTESDNDNLAVQFRPRRQTQLETRTVAKVINCTGPNVNYSQLSTPLIVALREKGLLQADTIQLGIACDENGALFDKSNQASKVLYTLGPPSKGRLWEITAVPDIRKQSASLAKFLLHR